MPSEDSSKAECLPGNGSHCFEHGTRCCHCGKHEQHVFVSREHCIACFEHWALQAPRPEPEETPCEHGGGDMQDCPHGCAETLTPEQEARIDAKFAAAEAEHLETPCVGGHPEGECLCPPSCGCCKAEPAPPQPERRPPYAVAYAVQGHLYEAALPGDATVEAVDGVLVIRHSLGQVAGIVAVNPMSAKEES